MKKLSTVLRSIEIIEEKTNAMHEEFSKSLKDRENLPPMIINDQNVHLQLFFQHVEQLLQTDLKNRISLLNNNTNKKNYWNFFSQALKDSKGLYDTIVYVLNSQEVTTPTGRGRLFIRFCLQNHRLGDVIQHSFMTSKIVNQFYNDECFWNNPTYLNRIVQALYLLNEIRFDLLSDSTYQLDVSWPIVESMEIRSTPKVFIDQGLGERTNSTSSLVSMTSVDSQAIVSVVPEATSPSPIVPDSTETTEDPENSLQFWKEKYFQLEIDSKPISIEKIDVQVQCTMNEEKKSMKNHDREENDRLKLEINRFEEEIRQLNDRIASISMKNQNIEDFERERQNYRTKIETQESLLKELQMKLDEQTERFRTMNEQNDEEDQNQQQRVESLEIELKKSLQLLENERKVMEEERKSFQMTREQLETTIQEKTLDFEEMKRRLIKAVREKAELFNSIHNYEIKLEEEQSRKWMADEEVSACLKCNTTFGWTLRKHHCRQCQRIFCYYCSNNWIQNPKTNSPAYRVCDFCNDRLLKESFTPSTRSSQEMFHEHDNPTESVDTRFEVRSEKLQNPPTN